MLCRLLPSSSAVLGALVGVLGCIGRPRFIVGMSVVHRVIAGCALVLICDIFRLKGAISRLIGCLASCCRRRRLFDG